MKLRNEAALSLNFDLPEIKTSHRFSKSLKDNNKFSLVKKLNEINTKKYQRNDNIVNHIKNLSRNISKINYKKRKNSSSNKEKNINNNINNDNLTSTIYTKKKNKQSYNLTISCTFKVNKREKDSNKNNTLIYSNNLMKYSNIHNEKNNSLINSDFINRNIYSSISDNYSLYENNNQGNKIYNINNRYIDYNYSDYNTPNKTNQKNYDLSQLI